MNNARRKELEGIIEMLSNVKERLDEVSNEEHDAYDNMPESLQNSERGEAMSEGIDTMDEIAGQIEDAIDSLNDLI